MYDLIKVWTLSVRREERTPNWLVDSATIVASCLAKVVVIVVEEAVDMGVQSLFPDTHESIFKTDL